MTSKQTKKLDGLWSTRIHLRDQHCKKCGTSEKKLEAAHIIGRTCRATRWDLRNGILLCFAHHHDYDHHLKGMTDWVISYIGKKMWDELHGIEREHYRNKTKIFYQDIYEKLYEEEL